MSVAIVLLRPMEKGILKDIKRSCMMMILQARGKSNVICAHMKASICNQYKAILMNFMNLEKEER